MGEVKTLHTIQFLVPWPHLVWSGCTTAQGMQKKNMFPCVIKQLAGFCFRIYSC
jgi:hypothetical protein